MDKKETKQWWDEKVENKYFTAFSFSFSRPDLISRFHLDANSYILEIGFGYGRELSNFCQISTHTYGVDLAAKAPEICLEKLRARGITNLPKVQSYDGNNLPYPDGMFDFVYNCFVMQHMRKRSCVELLTEIQRVLKPSGFALLEFFGDMSFYKLGLDDDVFSVVTETDKMYNNAFTSEEIKQIAIEVGAKLHWIDVQVINANFSNYWACFSR